MKTNLHKMIGADATLMEDGVWENICAGIRVKVGSSESRRYRHAMRMAVINNNVTPGDAIEGELLDKLMMEATANGLVLDWEGIVDEDNQPIPCTQDNIIEILSDPDLQIFFDRITAKAQNLAAFRKAHQEEDAKNS